MSLMDIVHNMNTLLLEYKLKIEEVRINLANMNVPIKLLNSFDFNSSSAYHSLDNPIDLVAIFNTSTHIMSHFDNFKKKYLGNDTALYNFSTYVKSFVMTVNSCNGHIRCIQNTYGKLRLKTCIDKLVIYHHRMEVWFKLVVNKLKLKHQRLTLLQRKLLQLIERANLKSTILNEKYNQLYAPHYSTTNNHLKCNIFNASLSIPVVSVLISKEINATPLKCKLELYFTLRIAFEAMQMVLNLCRNKIEAVHRSVTEHMLGQECPVAVGTLDELAAQMLKFPFRVVGSHIQAQRAETSYPTNASVVSANSGTTRRIALQSILKVHKPGGKPTKLNSNSWTCTNSTIKLQDVVTLQKLSGVHCLHHKEPLLLDILTQNLHWIINKQALLLRTYKEKAKQYNLPVNTAGPVHSK